MTQLSHAVARRRQPHEREGVEIALRGESGVARLESLFSRFRAVYTADGAEPRMRNQPLIQLILPFVVERFGSAQQFLFFQRKGVRTIAPQGSDGEEILFQRRLSRDERGERLIRYLH